MYTKVLIILFHVLFMSVQLAQKYTDIEDQYKE